MRVEEYVREKLGRGRSLYRVLEELYRSVEAGKVRLRDPRPPETFVEFLARPAYALWLYTSLALMASALLLVWLTSYFESLLPLRYLLGSIYVLFLPGYSLIEALYPEEGRLSPLERLALSIGLSLAVVPLIGLALNYTPWGIRLEPYLASSASLITVLLFTAAYRKYRILAESERLREAEA